MSKPIVLVTGAARRGGLAIAKAFARAGCDLVLTTRPGRPANEEAATALRAMGAQIHWHEIELDDPQTVEAFGLKLATSQPRLDVVVHSASSYTSTALADLTAQHALDHYRVNALAPLLLSKHLAPRLAESALPHGGAIVTMLDIHALGRPRRYHLAYAMSKAALAEMTRGLALELAPRVRVNGVAPGVIGFAESGPDADAAMQAAYLRRVPLGRSGTFEESADIVRWLALDAAYVTGQIVRIDGGRWLT
jgi:pteridine reductase